MGERAGARASALHGGEPQAERIALVGETLADVREVMIEGPSGILAIVAAATGRASRPAGGGWSGPTARWRRCFSSEDPESLRGPQFDAAWCDELAKWKNAEATLDMLQFGLRLGEQPRQLMTTTPRPTRLLKTADGRSGGEVPRG